jgi:hypothetical protein
VVAPVHAAPFFVYVAVYPVAAGVSAFHVNFTDVVVLVPHCKFNFISGFTVIVYCCFDPLQLFNVGSTSTVLVIAEAIVLVAVKDGVLPVPLPDPKPTAVLLFVHAYVAPDGVDENAEAATVAPLHGVRLVSVLNVGVGFIVIVNVFTKPGQPLNVGITDTVPTMSTPVAFAGAV